MDHNPATPSFELSVIIPAAGRRDLLVRCLASLGHDDSRCPFEVCVIDDASGLDEKDIRASADVSCPLLWIAGETKKGQSVARNTGVEKTSGRIVVFLDSDMEVLPGFLDAHHAAHLAHPRTAVIGAIQWPEGGSFRRYIGSRGIAKLAPEDSVPARYFVTGNASVERVDLPSERPFDETLEGWGGEDLDLGLRLEKAGIGFLAARDAVACHHFTGSLSGHLARTTEYGRVALPVLAARHPEIKRITGLENLASPFWRLLINDAFFKPAGYLAERLDFLPIPDILFDYLTFAAYARGWTQEKKT